MDENGRKILKNKKNIYNNKMSKLYKLIEEQVNILLRFIMEDDRGQIQYGKWIQGPKWVKPFIQFVTTIIFLLIILAFGLYLWNYGLHPVMPGLIARIDSNNPLQARNPYAQLVLTLLALMLIF